MATDKAALDAAKTKINQNIDEAFSFVISEKNPSKEHIATGIELMKRFSGEGNQIRAADIFEHLAEQLTKSGQTIQAASLWNKLTPEGQILTLTRKINSYNKKIQDTGGLFGLGKKLPGLSKEQIRGLLDEARKIAEIPDELARKKAEYFFQDKLASFIPSSGLKKAVTVWKAGLLTGLKTSGLNIGSNISHSTLLERVKDIPSAGIDIIASLFTKKRTLPAFAGGYRKGLKEGAEKGWEYVATGFDERNIGAKLDLQKVNFSKAPIGRFLQKYTNTVFRVIGGEDQPFFYGSLSRAIFSQVKANGMNQGLKGTTLKEFIENGIKNPSEDILKTALKEAEIAVFANKTKLGQLGRGIQKMGGGLGEFAVPFSRTPSAVAMQVINYSPIGFIKTVAENIGKGKFNQRAFSQGIGRAITGTTILGLGAHLMNKNKITLNYPTTDRERRQWELEGKQANSIKIGQPDSLC